MAHTTRPGLCYGVCFTLIISGRQGRMFPARMGLPFGAGQERMTVGVGCEPVDVGTS